VGARDPSRGIDALQKLYSRGSTDDRTAADHAVSRLRLPPEQELGFLRQGLREDIVGLGGADSVRAALPLPLLAEALHDTSGRVRSCAVLGVARAGPARYPGLVDTLARLLSDPYIYTRGGACEGLRRLGHRAASAIPALETMAAQDPAFRIREQARRALLEIRR